MTIERTCAGACCAVFWLSEPMLRGIKQRAAEEPASQSAFILDMIVPLSPVAAAERASRFGAVGPGVAKIAEQPEGEHWTCRHWDEQTRLCKVYDQRPDMCRYYPYGKGCSHGCSYDITDPNQIQRYAQQWSWRNWRWRGDRYYLRPAVDGASWNPGDGESWKPGRGWVWDPAERSLRPEMAGWHWDHRRRKWQED